MRIGVDLGGTKIEAVALLDDGSFTLRQRVATPQGAYEETLAAIVSLVEKIESDLGERGSVGVAIPGAISPASGLIKNANSTCLNGQPFDRHMAERLGRPVRCANDANCFALSEATDGAGKGMESLFGVILGTGVGGGIVVAGKLHLGANAIGGEWGHNPLPQPGPTELPGPDCYCGRRGCIETFLSGPALAQDWLAEGHRENAESGLGGGLGGEALVAAAAGGDPQARVVLARYQDRLARALAMVVNVLDPEVIVLGGGLSKIESLYETLPGLLPAYVFSDRVDTRILPPQHGDSSGVRGAAWLWDKSEVPEAIGRSS